MKYQPTLTADGLVVSEYAVPTDAELASLIRQGYRPEIRYEGGIEPDEALRAAA